MAVGIPAIAPPIPLTTVVAAVPSILAIALPIAPRVDWFSYLASFIVSASPIPDTKVS